MWLVSISMETSNLGIFLVMKVSLLCMSPCITPELMPNKMIPDGAGHQKNQ